MSKRKILKSGACATRSGLSVAWLVVAASALSGCSLSPLAKQTAAFSSATTTVVTSSKDAYRKTNSLYFEEVTSSAIFKYDAPPPPPPAKPWDPTKVTPLLSEAQLQARFELLDGLKTYAQDIDALENAPKNLKGLDTASEGVGNGLLSVSTNLNAVLTSANSGATTTTLTQDQANLISTATYALSEFFASRKVQSRLPEIIEKMDPTIRDICTVLESDIATIQVFTGREYSEMLSQQSQFINHAQGLNSVERRAEIAKLPKLAQRQQYSLELLTDLKAALVALRKAHEALAHAASDKSTPLATRIADFEAAAQQLASYYSTLPTS
jgi:hypothetical protein